MGKAAKAAARSAAAAAAPQGKSSSSSSSSSAVLPVLVLLVATGAGYYLLREHNATARAAAASSTLRHVQQCGRYGAGAVPGCSPTGRTCGHLVVEEFASEAEVEALREIAARGMQLGGGAGGPTILDLQSGALSYKDKFIDVWTAFNATGAAPFRRSEVAVYVEVVERIRALAERTFGVGGRAAGAKAAARARRLHLTAPTFFSRISGDKEPQTAHDEYWHAHVDLEQYGSFVFTSLLYLADGGGRDFAGGAFEFLAPGTPQQLAEGANAGAGAAGTPVATVEPRRGSLVLFSSGPEHPHRITRVTEGTRLALTIAFTCDERAAIEDFLGRSLPD